MNAETGYIPVEAVRNDRHRTVEAQGFIAIAAIKNQIEAALPEDRRAPIRNWFEVLEDMTLAQGHPTRDDRDKAHYSDGSPVFRFVLDGTVADVEDYLDGSVDDFDYIGDVAEYLYSSTLNTGCQVGLNSFPVQQLREPRQLVQRLRKRLSTASVVDGTASVGDAGHGESE